MIGFYIKKGFFDIWDNFLGVFLMNIGYAALLALFLVSMTLGADNTALGYSLLVVTILLFSFYSLGVSGVTYGYVHYKKLGFRAFKEAFRDHWAHAILYFLVVAAIVLCYTMIMPFYFALGNLFGLFLGMVVFWVGVFLILAMQFYYPLCFHVESDSPIKTLRKCFMVAGDNIGFALFMILRTAVDLVLTILTATLLPGLTGMSVIKMGAMKILMFKYDFFEANPGTTKKDVNWEDLLYEEKEILGPRTLKNTIFPWKD